MHDIIALEEFSAETATRAHQREESADCPDCFDSMVKFYGWDTIRYVCENCDLTSSGIFCEDEIKGSE